MPTKLKTIKPPKIAPDDAKGWQKEARRLRQELVRLSNVNRDVIFNLDAMMKLPRTPKWDKDMAQIANVLNFANDYARHFGLGIEFKSVAWKRPAK